MDEELESFIRERKARMAADKASLQQDPPYMQIKAEPHRAYGSTVKENIPPSLQHTEKFPERSLPSPRRDESCIVGLPLGVEYEKKKQRLQHQLRMDYRRFMSQKNHFDHEDPGALIFYDNRRPNKTTATLQLPLEDQASVFPKQTRGLRLAEVSSSSPEVDGGPASVLPRHRERREMPVEQNSEEDEEMEGRRRSNLGTSYERSQSTGNDGRVKRENVVGVGREGRRPRSLRKHEDTEFVTGLLIGAADTDEALQRRKERYRHELQEQIAEQHRNKKREKDLELKVAATGANDPEKQPDRIRQFGLSRRRGPLLLEPLATGESGSSSRAAPSNKKREREMPPPEQPHVAFQSPLLEYSSALGLSPTGQPSAPSFPSAMDIPRNPVYLSHPPPLSEAYRTPYGEPHQYYGTRNLLDPNMAYYGNLPVPSAGYPMSYWSGPPGGAVSSQFGDRSPHSLHSGCSFPEPSMYSCRPSNESAAVDSHASCFPPERSRSARDRILSYREALKQQIQEQQERRRLEQEERERYEARLEAEMKNHQPWGRGGGGAPLRDSTGNLIADLNRMHKLNEEAYSNPEQWQRRAMMARQAEQPDPNERVSGFTHVHTPQFARGNVFSNQATEQQLQEQDKYKAYLKQQIEEKLRKKAEERERTRQEEEKEEKRLAEQRARIQREYEEEQERRKLKELEQKAKNEELIQLAEQRKMGAERKKKEEEEKENAALRRQYERERQTRVEEGAFTSDPHSAEETWAAAEPPRPPTVDSQHSAAPFSERSLSGLESPPVPACRNQLRAAGHRHDLFSELSALRQQLRSEQKRLESRLQQEDWEDLDSPTSFRHRERPTVDVFDMARLRLQAPVRRPNSRNMEPRNLLRIHDSLQLKYRDGESRLQGTGLTSRRSRNYRDSHHQFSSQRSTVQDDYLDLSPSQQNDYQRNARGESERGFLLESESAFIDPLGDASPVPQAPELERIGMSARERRRLAKQSQRPQERGASSQRLGRHEDYPNHSGNQRQREAEPGGEWRSRNRTGRMMALSRRGNTAGPLDVSDEDSSPHSLNHQSSMETVATDPWTRPGTSDTLKCLDRPLRRHRPTT